MCKEYVIYKSFDELPEELKEKFKSEAGGHLLDKAKEGYVDFINQLNKRNDELIEDYVGALTKTQVRFGECGHVADISPDRYKRRQGCAVCYGQQVHQGTNDLATTHPQYVKYFVNINDSYIHTYGSSKKVELKCPECDYVKSMRIADFTRQGFGCPCCSDGVSYPEKFVANLLRQLNITYKKEYTLDNGNARYDFYLPVFNCIIEVHGGQHYGKGFESCGGRSLKEEQANDKYKRELAIQLKIKNYVVIDARESNMFHIKNSIINSKLQDLLSLSENEVDWENIDEKCQKSLVKEVCFYFAKNGASYKELRELFGICDKTIMLYLKRGEQIGWCKYDKKELTTPRAVRGTHKETGKILAFDSVGEASRYLKGNKGNISKCCNGERKSAYGYIWSYIDDVEETDNQHQTNQNT